MRTPTSGNDLLRGFVPPEFVRAAWKEWNISRQCVTGAGDRYIPEFADGPSDGFYGCELGFGWRNVEKDMAQTSRTLRADNHARKQSRKSLRDQEGCTGCPSCVAGARIAPKQRLIRLAGSFAAWVPHDPNCLGRRATNYVERQRRAPAELEQRRKVRELTAGSRELRTIVENEKRAEEGLPLIPRRHRNGLQARRAAEETTMRSAARRARYEARRALGRAATRRLPL